MEEDLPVLMDERVEEHVSRVELEADNVM